jgi:hypothetical protein
MQLGILLLSTSLCLASFWVAGNLLLALTISLCILSFLHLSRKVSILELLPYFLWLTLSVVLAPAVALAVVLAVQIRLYLAYGEFLSRQKLANRANQLKSLLPKESLVFVDMDIEAKSPRDQIQEGHLVRLHAGDSAPHDGVITFGSGIFDESAVSNDHDPKIKGMGNQVLAGSRVTNGSLIYRVSTSMENSFLEKLANGLNYQSKSPRWFFLFDFLPILCAAYIYLTERDFAKASIPLFFSFGYAILMTSRIRNFGFRLAAADLGVAAKDFSEIAKIGSCVGSSRPLLKESKCAWLESTGDWSEDAILQFVGPLARKLEDEASYAVLHEMQKRKISLEILDSFTIHQGNVSGIIQGQEFEWISYGEAIQRKLPLENYSEFLNKHFSEGNWLKFLIQEKNLKGVMAFQHKIRPQVVEGKSLIDKLGLPFVLVSPQRSEELQDLSNFPLKHQADSESQVNQILEKLETESLFPVWLDSREYVINKNCFSGAFSKNSSPVAHFAHLHLISVFQLLALAKHFRKKEAYFVLHLLILQGLSLAFFLHQHPNHAALASLIFLLVGYFQAKWVANPTTV